RFLKMGHPLGQRVVDLLLMRTQGRLRGGGMTSVIKLLPLGSLSGSGDAIQQLGSPTLKLKLSPRLPSAALGVSHDQIAAITIGRTTGSASDTTEKTSFHHAFGSPLMLVGGLISSVRALGWLKSFVPRRACTRSGVTFVSMSVTKSCQSLSSA